MSIHVPFGCFLILRSDVLRSTVFAGDKMFMCFWINKRMGLTTATKDMSNIIPYERNCSDCLNGCPISTTKEAFTTSFHNDHGEMHVLTNRVPIQVHALQHLICGGVFNALGSDDSGKTKESKKNAASTSNKKRQHQKSPSYNSQQHIWARQKNGSSSSSFAGSELSAEYDATLSSDDSKEHVVVAKISSPKKERNKSCHPTMLQNFKVP